MAQRLSPIVYRAIYLPSFLLTMDPSPLDFFLPMFSNPFTDTFGRIISCGWQFVSPPIWNLNSCDCWVFCFFGEFVKSWCFLLYFMVGEIRALLIKKGYLLFMKQFYINSIRKNINSLNVDQLYTLFHVYLQLDSLCDFFMSEESHIQFINSYYNVSSIRNPETFKTFMNFSMNSNNFGSVS